jgi:protein-disulfide isomerase
VSKQFIAILVVIVGGLFAILAFTSKDKPSESSNTNSTAQPTSHKTGKLDSKVTLQEFGDFQCPACKAYFPIVQQIKTEYADKIVFQFSHFPLTQIHTNAFISSRAAEAAGKQGKFFEMHDLLYEQQDSWSAVTDPTSIFVNFATQLGINVDQFKTDILSSEVSDLINADRKVAQDLGANSTPTFAINGKKIDKNPTDIEGFKALLDEALASNQ